MTMQLPNIWQDKKDEVLFVRRTPSGRVVICRNDCTEPTACALVMSKGKRAIAVSAAAAARAGVMLDDMGKWDADQCIATLHKMLVDQS